MVTLYLAALAAFLLGAVVYYVGWFVFAGLVALVFAVLMGAAVAGAMGPVAAGVLIALFLAGPAVFLGVHAVDARKGIFLLPTIYSIPLAFVCGALMLVVTGLALLLA